MGDVAQDGVRGSAGPGVTTIADLIVFYGCATGAVLPFKAGDIAVLENDLGGLAATIVAKPGVQIVLYRGHSCGRVASVRGEHIRLPMYFKDGKGSDRK